MRLTKMTFKRSISGALWLALIVFTAFSCNNISADNNKTTLDEQDVQTASQIIGESLASNSDGMMSSMGDVAAANSNGFDFGKNPALSIPYSSTGNTSRSSDYNFSISYDTATGVHTITYDRTVDRHNISKEVHVVLEITFRDSTGAFLRFPVSDKLESIDFKDSRKGSFQSDKKNSTFNRKDTLLFTGLRPSSDLVSINGSHYGSGDFQWTDSTGTMMERTYNMKIDFVDVTIPKSDISDSDLSQGVTGTLTYDITLNKKNGSNTQKQHMSGTIELNGDGTALLRFAHFPKRFLVHLNTGDVVED